MTITLDANKVHPAATDEENALLRWAAQYPEREGPKITGGRYQIEDPTTGKMRGWTRMSSLAKTLDDNTAITKWEKANVARGIKADPDMLARIDDPRALAAAAGKRGGDTLKADLGTAMHAALELWIDDQDPDEFPRLPAPYDADLKAIVAALKRHGIKPDRDFTEAVLLHPDVEAAGRCDFAARGPWDGLRICDLKTGSIDFGVSDWCAQLAGYATAPYRWTPDEIIKAEPRDTTRGIILHAPLGQGICHVYEVDLVKGLEILTYAYGARKYRRSDPNLMVPHQVPHTEPVHVSAPLAQVVDDLGAKTDQWIVDRLRAVKSNPQAVAIITSTWPQGVGFAPPWTAVQREAIAEVVDAGERAVSAPFPPEKPTAPEPPTAIAPIQPPVEPPELVAVSVCEALKASFGKLPPARITQFVAWRAQAIEAAVSFDSERPEGTAWPVRVYNIVNAAHDCLAHLWDDENPDALTRAALVLVLGDDAVQPTFATGALLGSLTPDEARRLAQIAVAFGNNDAETMQRLGSALVAA